MNNQYYHWVLSSILLTCILLFFYSCSTSKSKIPYPIILIHGFGGSANTWSENYNIVQFFQDSLGLDYGGKLKINEVGTVLNVGEENKGFDFFTANFSDNYSSIWTQVNELTHFVKYVRNRTRSKKVVLVAFSMGGLTSRAYLVSHRGNHHVKKLLTIGSPHLGSPIALIYDLKKWAIQNAIINDDNYNNISISNSSILNLLRSVLTEDIISYLNSWFVSGANTSASLSLNILEGIAQIVLKDTRISFSVPALADLRPPRSNKYNSYFEGLLPDTTFLYKLNNSPHPLDVEYSCIIGQIDLAENVEKIYNTMLSNATTTDHGLIVKNILYPFGNTINDLLFRHQGNGNIFSGGDGVVSTDSQNMANIQYFQEKKILVEVFNIENVGHLEECWNHRTIIEALGQGYLVK